MTPSLSDLPALLTVQQLADLLQISEKAAYQRVARGLVPGVVRQARRVRIMRDVYLKSLYAGVQR